MNKEAREHVKRLEAQGWRLIGIARSGHLRLVHETGARIQVGSTPSDPRGRKNELARARRKVKGAAR